jgi:hypothetical protein
VRRLVFVIAAIGLALASAYITLVAASPYIQQTAWSSTWGYRNSKAGASLSANFDPDSHPIYYWNIQHGSYGIINPNIPDYIKDITTVDPRPTISNNHYHPYTVTDTWVQVGAGTPYYWDNEAEVLF